MAATSDRGGGRRRSVRAPPQPRSSDPTDGNGDSRSAGRAAPAGMSACPLRSRIRERLRASDQELEHVLVVPGCRGTEWGGCGTSGGQHLFRTKTGERPCSSPACAFLRRYWLGLLWPMPGRAARKPSIKSPQPQRRHRLSQRIQRPAAAAVLRSHWGRSLTGRTGLSIRPRESIRA